MYLRDRSAERRHSVCQILADHFSSVHRIADLAIPPEVFLNELIVSYEIDEAELVVAFRKHNNVKSGLDEIPLTL